MRAGKPRKRVSALLVAAQLPFATQRDLPAQPQSVHDTLVRQPFDNDVSHVAAWIAWSGRARVPDQGAARRFLATLDPGAREFSFRTFSDTPYTRIPGSDPLERAIHGTLDELWPDLVALNRLGAAISVTISETNGRGRTPADITRARALFLDDDRPQRRLVWGFPVPPHLTVQSSPGRFHHYWRVADVPLDAFVGLQRRLAARYLGDSKACALNQSMALPGCWRLKDVGSAHQVLLGVSRPGTALSTSELRALLGDG